MSSLIVVFATLVLSQLHTYRFYHLVSLLTPHPTPAVQGAHTEASPTPPASPFPLPSPKPIPTPSSPHTPTPSSLALSVKPSAAALQAVGISESSLWDALVTYRASQNRTSVIREEPLCQYARKRVAQHAGRTDLDNHSGFQADADSGALFSETGDSFTEINEVLAYLPNVQTATQVIEWGWDSSPAHREGLLSNDSTHACIVGTAPFYVGILGHR